MKLRLTLTVNGEAHDLEVESHARLSAALRDGLGLTGLKEACGTSSCGACTVLIDGKAVKSCSVLALQAKGRAVLTIEGLEENGRLHPLQEAFIEGHGMQCGYCTPGMIMSLTALLAENTSPSERDVREAIGGNLCRCGTYSKIVTSTLSAAEKIRSA